MKLSAAIALATLLALGLFAHMFRYEPIPQRPGWVWDRFAQRACLTLEDKVLCYQEPQAMSDDTGRGAAQFQHLLDVGVPREDAENWKRQATQTLLEAGMAPADIDAYWGVKNPRPDGTFR